MSLAELQPDIQFYRCEAEAAPDLSLHYSVTVVPTFVLCVGSENKVIDKVEGEDAATLTQAVGKLQSYVFEDATASGTPPPNTTAASSNELVPESKSAEEFLKERMESLVHASKVMVFMKGTPTAPRCGFSRQVVEILQESAIEFGSFDILGPNDQDVRQGLKVKSDWPTYPQIYVDGELVGGLDILKEMGDEGDLAEQFGVTKQETTEERLKKLLKRSHIMLFMKGLPSAPKCGFSRQIVEILEEQNVSFDSFNILEDEEVRQGLKSFSDWPTYPQLYVSGELVGGLDIVREMKDSGDLVDLLQ